MMKIKLLGTFYQGVAIAIIVIPLLQFFGDLSYVSVRAIVQFLTVYLLALGIGIGLFKLGQMIKTLRRKAWIIALAISCVGGILVLGSLMKSAFVDPTPLLVLAVPLFISSLLDGSLFVCGDAEVFGCLGNLLVVLDALWIFSLAFHLFAFYTLVKEERWFNK